MSLLLFIPGTIDPRQLLLPLRTAKPIFKKGSFESCLLSIFAEKSPTTMAILTLEIQDKKIQFFKDLISNFRFVKIKEEELAEDTDEEVIANITQGIKELRLIEQDKLKSRPAREFLKEL
jgi:hypothetical protein